MKEGNAIIRMHYPGTDPETLSDSRWAELIEGWRFVTELEKRRFEHSLGKVLTELAVAIYKNRR